MSKKQDYYIIKMPKPTVDSITKFIKNSTINTLWIAFWLLPIFTQYWFLTTKNGGAQVLYFILIQVIWSFYLIEVRKK
jgi:hypothetical protein